MFILTAQSHDSVFLVIAPFGLRESEVDLLGKKEVKDVSVSIWVSSEEVREVWMLPFNCEPSSKKLLG